MSGLGRQMATAQERFDWQLPPGYWDTDADNAAASWDNAIETATELHLSCGAGVAAVLAEICDPLIDGKLPGRDEIKIGELCQTSDSKRDDYDPMGRPAYELLAVVMLGGPVSVERALRYLREAVAAGMEREINETAQALIAKGGI